MAFFREKPHPAKEPGREKNSWSITVIKTQTPKTNERYLITMNGQIFGLGRTVAALRNCCVKALWMELDVWLISNTNTRFSLTKVWKNIWGFKSKPKEYSTHFVLFENYSFNTKSILKIILTIFLARCIFWSQQWLWKAIIEIRIFKMSNS